MLRLQNETKKLLVDRGEIMVTQKDTGGDEPILAASNLFSSLRRSTSSLPIFLFFAFAFASAFAFF